MKLTYNNKKGELYKQYIKIALPKTPIGNVFALFINEETYT